MKRLKLLSALLPLLLLALTALASLAGCRRPSLPQDLSPETWMQTDPAACIRHYEARFAPHLDSAEAHSLLHIFERIQRCFPPQPAGNRDSVIKYTTRMLNRWHRLCHFSTGYTGCYRLADSLLRSSHPFLNGEMRPEMLAHSMRLHMFAAWYGSPGATADAVDSLARIFYNLPPLPDPAREASTCNAAARNYYFACSDRAFLISLQERAVRAFRQGGDRHASEGAEVLANMGEYYYLANHYEQGVQLLQEAIDWNLAHPEASNRGTVGAYRNLCTLYALLKLYDEALTVNAQAIAHAADDKNQLTDLYRLRGVMFAGIDKPDSALACYNQAISLFRQLNDTVSINYVLDSHHSTYLDAYPDSAQRIVESTAHLYLDYPQMPAASRNLRRYQYGLALYHSGSPQQGLKLMEDAFGQALARQVPEQVEGIGRILMKLYIHQGKPEKVGDIYRPYVQVHDSLQDADRARSVVAANIRYETGRKEQANRALTAEVKLKQRTLALTWTLTGLLCVVLVATYLYFRQRQRYQRRVSNARLTQISNLLDTQQRLKQHNRELTEVLLRLQPACPGLSAAAGIHADADNDSDTDNDSAANNDADAADIDTPTPKPLSPTEAICLEVRTHNFDIDGETNLRRSFQSVFPKYLPTLHRLAPDLTRTDELIAILIYLGFNNNEIALTLNIARSSLHKARSRMRKRLTLEQTTNLDEFLKRL